MNIAQALKDEDSNLRISATNNRWLVWDNTINLWVVYSRPSHAKKTITVYTGADEQTAVALLLEE